MTMATYSAFFSSGLLAPNHYVESRARTPTPSSPLPLPSSPDWPLDIDRNTPTPTPTLPSVPDKPSHPASISNATGSAAPVTTPVPRLRKRRSSLTVSASAKIAIKTPIRSAGAALQRAMNMSVVSPGGRNRSGSVGNEALLGGGSAPGTAKNLLGRSRSGSVGGSLRPRRRVRRTPSPAAPPPTAPLPALPSLEIASPVDIYPPIASAPARATSVSTVSSTRTLQRPPLTRRMHSSDNNGINNGGGGGEGLQSPMFLSLDFATKVAIAMKTPEATSPADERGYFDAVYRIDEEMKENT